MCGEENSLLKGTRIGCINVTITKVLIKCLQSWNVANLFNCFYQFKYSRFVTHGSLPMDEDLIRSFVLWAVFNMDVLNGCIWYKKGSSKPLPIVGQLLGDYDKAATLNLFLRGKNRAHRLKKLRNMPNFEHAPHK